MKKLSICLFALCMLCVYAASAQQPITLQGKVTDETGAPVEGVSVSIEGTDDATSTNESGDFRITYSPPATLRVSALGYVSQEIALTNQTTVDVRLVAAEETLEEVVVVGYGTQRKGEVTSAIASVRSEDFVKGTVRDAAQLVQGKVAGLRITTPNGDPNATTQI